MAEGDLVRDIQVSLQSDSHAVLWRNNVGTGWQGEVTRIPKQKAVLIKHPRLITFGVGSAGAADLLGLTTVQITPEMVGQWVALFTSVECKRLKGREAALQKKWAGVMQAAGALHVNAKHRRDVLQMLENARNLNDAD